MTTAFDAPHDELEEPRGLTPTKVALALVIVAIVAMWAWIYLFAPRSNPDRLESTGFAVAAEPVCAAIHEQIDALPTGRDVDTVAARTAAIVEATELTETMIASLRAIADTEVTAADDRRIVDAWFADWDFYVEDRRRHIDKLETLGESASGDDFQFLLRERAEGGIYTRRIDGLANVNDMESCHIPGDI